MKSALKSLLFLSVFVTLGFARDLPPYYPPDTFVGELRFVHAMKPYTIDLARSDKTIQKFTLREDCKISTVDNPSACLHDLKIGDKLSLFYIRKGDDYFVYTITVKPSKQ